MKDAILENLKDKKILILGLGKEGWSTYRFIRKYFPEQLLTLSDRNERVDVAEVEDTQYVNVILGEAYLDRLNDYDLIIKSPGVNLNTLGYYIAPEKIMSQTALFMQAFSSQVIGVTGTKGKSTTASLIYQILDKAGKKVFLAGNIGIPFFDIVEQITPDSLIVAELSAHQLEYLRISPHVAVLLNLFQEHLDHFNSLSDYVMSKWNITAFQKENDYFIYNYNDRLISSYLKMYQYQRKYLPFSRDIKIDTGAYSQQSFIFLMENGEKIASFELEDMKNLPGQHNYNNVMAALLVAKIMHLENKTIVEALKMYKGLEHRLEMVGTFRQILFYNDSISTIPETTIAALNTLRKVDTLILGGFDRGIAYDALIRYLSSSEVKNIAFTGPVGKRVIEEWKKSALPLPSNYIVENDFCKIIDFAYQFTRPGKICLLSPAASSYDQFKNFEDRGKCFKKMVSNYNRN